MTGFFQMQHFVYILHSKMLSRYYTGKTSLEPHERLKLHLTSYYGKTKFTAKTDDWELVLSIRCISPSQAERIEKHIKSMKSSTYIQNLIKYPEMRERITTKFME